MTSSDRFAGVRDGTAIKAPCRVATTAAITLSALQTIDGVALAEDDRVLVKNQASGVDNGIYTASTGTWQRAKDFDGNRDVVTGTLVFVTNGTVSAGLIYQQTTANPITIGSSAIAFSVYSFGTSLTLPLAVGQGGTGGDSASDGLAALGVVEVTGIGGTANAITGGIAGEVSAFRTNQVFLLTPTAANTTAATLTLTPSGAGALAGKNIFANGAALVGGELQAGIPVVLVYDGTQLNIIGPAFPSIPQNSQIVNYTTVLSDANKHLLHPSSDNNPRTFTIAANAAVAYPIGTALTFVNMINTLTIAINADTLTLMGSGATGSRTLAVNGIATALKIASTSWVISGTNLT